MICDEIFGRDNFINNAIWQKKYAPANDAKWFSDDHDFILMFAKNKDIWRPNKLERTEKQNKIYTNKDDDKRGRWRSDNYLQSKSKEERPNGWYAIIHPKTGEEIWPNSGSVWRYTKEQHLKHVAENRIWWGAEKENDVPAFKRFLSDVGGIVPQTIWPHEQVGHNQEAKREIMQIFNKKDGIFQTPKPVRLLSRVLKIAAKSDSVILDSFAGSGTTAHAVQALNAEDGGNRKFILVETEDYADTITAERVRRVIKGVPNAKDEALKNGLGGSFTYCDLGDPIDMESFFGESESMPAYDQLASYIAYTATGEALGKAPKKPAKDWFIGEVGGVRLHLIYKPDGDFMKSHQAALDMDTVKTIAAGNKSGKPSYVFAAAKYMGQSELTRDYDMTFCQLPYAIHRIMGDGVDG